MTILRITYVLCVCLYSLSLFFIIYCFSLIELFQKASDYHSHPDIYSFGFRHGMLFIIIVWLISDFISTIKKLNRKRKEFKLEEKSGE